MALSLPTFPAFDVHSGPGSGVRWKKWLQRFENLLLAMAVTDDTRKRALLLHYVGEETYEIFDTIPDHGEKDEYARATGCLTDYFSPKRNHEYEIYVFRQTQQRPGETMDTYHTRLRQLAVTCEFTDVDKEIKSQIIQCCLSSKLRRQALKDSTMTLKQLLDSARITELSESQAHRMEDTTDGSVNAFRERKQKPRPATVDQPKLSEQSRYKRGTKCFKCGYDYPHKFDCPAKGKRCMNCNIVGHFAKCCRSPRNYGKPLDRRIRTDKDRTVKRLEDLCLDSDACQSQDSNDDDGDDHDYVYGVTDGSLNIQQEHSDNCRPTSCSRQTANGFGKSSPKANIRLQDTQLKMLIDTGASVNILDKKCYDSLRNRPPLMRAKTTIFPYGSNKPLPVCGKFNAELESRHRITNALFYVVDGANGSLLGYDTARELGVVQVTNAILISGSDNICEEYAALFDGLGKLKDTQIKLHIDTSVQPCTQPHRRIPFHIRKKVERELERLESLDIIERVDGPTPWVSPIVVAPKPKSPDEIRICIDMRLPNKAVKRERHIAPTVDDLLVDLNGAKIFSKLDLKNGYHQLELTPESRYITTFSTHVGLRRYKRLNFGISSAAEIFQNTIRETLEGIPGTLNISDDILVFGKSQHEHDCNLRHTLQRLSERNLTLNKDKCKFNKKSLEFYGFIFSESGISPDPKKISALKNASAPETASEVRSILGLLSYVSRFIPDFSTISQPLRELTKKDTKWSWEKRHDDALNQLKELLTSDAVMAYFDPTANTVVIVDASPVGLGSILAQESKDNPGSKRIVAYASRALTDVETRYSQTEREALGIVWSCEHFHLYLLGHQFDLITDHKPLELIFNNPKSKPPARIERWALRLQPYDYVVKYRRGCDNPADYMSRRPVDLTSSDRLTNREQKIAEEYVNFIADNAVPKAMTLEEVKLATKDDNTLQWLIKTISNDTWDTVTDVTDDSINKSALQAFKSVKTELTVNADGDIVLRGCRIVLPDSLQKCGVELSHIGHQGIVKTKTLLREKVWFPGIDRMAEDLIKHCIPCQATTSTERREPLQMTELPREPWSNVSIDFCGPFPSGDYLLIVIDDYSRYPVVEIIGSTSARAVVPKLDGIFSMLGIPEVVKTDNGPPFNGEEFRSFSKYLGFVHRKVTPLWPRANGEVERFVKTIEKAIRAAHIDGNSWKQELHKFLRSYRATPHCSTNTSPAQALFNRKIRIQLPQINDDVSDNDIRVADSKAKNRMKQYADKSMTVRRHALHIGDTVLVKQRKRNKLSPFYNERPYVITDIKGTMITAHRDGHTITRNSSHFKPIRVDVTDSYDEEELPASVRDPAPLHDPIPEDDPPTPVRDQPHTPASRRYPLRDDRRPPTHLANFYA